MEFRLVNVIDQVDTTQSTNMQIGDSLKLLSFGRDLGNYLSSITGSTTYHQVIVLLLSIR